MSFNAIPENKNLKLPNLKYVLHGRMVAQLDNTLLVDLGEPDQWIPHLQI